AGHEADARGHPVRRVRARLDCRERGRPPLVQQDARRRTESVDRAGRGAAAEADALPQARHRAAGHGEEGSRGCVIAQFISWKYDIKVSPISGPVCVSPTWLSSSSASPRLETQ